MLGLIANLTRLLQLALVLTFSGVVFRFGLFVFYTKFAPRRVVPDKQLRLLGQALNRVLQSQGPSFIKLGQILSTRPDVIGDIVADELSKLRDELPSFSFEKVKKRLNFEFPDGYRKLFTHIDEKPIAAASIAQVHKGKTKDGQLVAIKVLRPGIEKKFASDLALFEFLARVVGCFCKKVDTLRPREIMKTLQRTVAQELDLRFEAASADALRENMRADAGIVIPAVYWQHSGKTVLTMEWIDGIPVDDREALLRAGHDLHAVSEKLAVAFFNQAYRDGFFHADLHPGNIFVDKNGDIVLVDFGIMGVLNYVDRIFIAKMLYGFISRDYQAVSDLHFEVGYVPAHQDRVLFALACRSIGEPIIGQPTNKISIGRLLKQLFDIADSFEMTVQPQLILLQKTMLTLEGVGYIIYPDVNMWQLAEPWIKQWAKDNFGIKAKAKGIKRSVEKFNNHLPIALSRGADLLDSLNQIISKDGISVVSAGNVTAKPRPPLRKIIALSLLSGFAIGIALITFS